MSNDQRAVATPPSLQLNPLDDERVWLTSDAFDAPLSEAEIAEVQKEIDAICGVTRDNKSIVKLVWNGDRRYWKPYHTQWNSLGKPVGELELRPRVLFKRVIDGKNNIARYAFPPRWLLLTRLEPEQYAPQWAFSSRIFDPVLGVEVQLLPEEPPKEYFEWFSTIAEHNGYCCGVVSKYGVNCNGAYAHPRACLTDLRLIRRGMEEDGVKDTNPFASADEVAAGIRERSLNDYEEQALRQVQESSMAAIDLMPVSLAPIEMIYQEKSIGQIREHLSEQKKREMEALEHKLKGLRQ